MTLLTHTILLIWLNILGTTPLKSPQPSPFSHYKPPYNLSPFQQSASNFMSNSLTLGTSITPASSTSTSSTSPPFTLLCLAPTGTGKSTIAYEFLSRVTNIMRYQEMDGVAVYTAPLKSIVSEKYRELKGIFEEGQVAMVTGDGSVNLTPSTSLVVCTTECLRNALYKSGRIGGKDVKGVCIDEFQYLGEGGRGGAIEEVMILSPPSVPMCFLTATMSNHESVSR
eukprot:CAMPEP_0118632970 /NCGR_PEP_ID=MMETSP0785-20121206/736_1 /TAXON_ID=91992 /ORGANISM="Bolidomonas pacifica, Strain CCMP 1866" /LENGTH=224 /DNA_ID=CAMNT_0006523791 /DNA_START=169 /DNA_END=840 /DNA_ORIENTATION=+